MTRDEIVLIGPVAVGKSTVAKCIGAKLDLPVVCMDDLRDGYFRELGYDADLAKRLYEADGAGSVWCYQKAFNPYSVERIIAEHADCVFDMGGGSTVDEHEDQHRRVANALRPFVNTVLLLPYADDDASLKYLDERTGWGGKARNINRILLAHPANRAIARHSIYTAGRAPEEIADRIIGETERPGPQG